MKMLKFVSAFHKRKSSSSPSSASSSSSSSQSDSSPRLKGVRRKSKDLKAAAAPFPSTHKSSSGLSNQLQGELEAVFRQFDTNGDGKISAMELHAVLRLLGDDATEDEILSILRVADSDGDGFIDFQEFLYLNTRAMEIAQGAESVEELRNAFFVFDADRNGFITAEELHQVLVGLGDQSTVDDCHRMIRGWDRNGDGFVDFEEFKTMMTAV